MDGITYHNPIPQVVAGFQSCASQKFMRGLKTRSGRMRAPGPIAVDTPLLLGPNLPPAKDLTHAKEH